MSKTALLAYSDKTEKWEASFGGRVIVRGNDKKYVIHVITKGLNAKAKALGVSKVEELGVASDGVAAHSEPLITFDINERFQFLEDYVDMAANRDRKSVVIVGEGGLGKSFTVFKQLKKNKLTDLQDMEVGASVDESNSKKTFVVIKGYSTAKGLFRTLFENKNRLVVFDDCDSILKDDVAANILKAALDSYDRRIVSWNAESFGESDLPKSFEFTGSVIFISNMSMHRIPQALISRAAPVDVSMTRPEIITRMREIVKQADDFMPDDTMEHKLEALEFIASHINNPQIRAINLRTLMAVTTNRRCKPATWQRLSLMEMMAAR